MFVLSGVFCFDGVASNYFQNRFSYSSVEAGSIMSINFLVCGLTCPFFGVIIDRYGKRNYFIILSSIFVFLAHFLFLVTPDSNKPIWPVFYMVLLGLGFAISSVVIWSSIPFITHIGSATAFGIVLSMCDAGLAIFPLIIGVIKDDNDEGYY